MAANAPDPPDTLPIYNAIGKGYVRSRRADPRIVDELIRLLDLPRESRLADVGAGTGNYTNALAERGYFLVAIEPSPVMRAQAVPHPRITWQEGVAETLPLPDASVAGIVSTLTLHHFTDLTRAFQEMSRVAGAGPLVFFTFDIVAAEENSPWLREYFPTLYRDDRHKYPPLAEVAKLAEMATGRKAKIIPFPLPPDLTDLFLAASWRRPEMYLDPNMRAGISAFALGDPDAITAGVERLRADLESGRWEEQYGAIRQQPTFDAGYRFLCLRR